MQQQPHPISGLGTYHMFHPPPWQQSYPGAAPRASSHCYAPNHSRGPTPAWQGRTRRAAASTGAIISARLHCHADPEAGHDLGPVQLLPRQRSDHKTHGSPRPKRHPKSFGTPRNTPLRKSTGVCCIMHEKNAWWQQKVGRGGRVPFPSPAMKNVCKSQTLQF